MQEGLFHKSVDTNTPKELNDVNKSTKEITETIVLPGLRIKWMGEGWEGELIRRGTS